MVGSGNYLIVGSLFDSPWMAWGGGLDKWGLFGQEKRFPTRQDAEGYLKDARNDAARESLRITVYVAHLQLGAWTGTVYHDGHEVAVNFPSKKLYVRQMEELGIL